MSLDHDHNELNEIEAAKKAARPKIERDQRYWLSLEQWSNDPEFQKLAEQEFLSSPLKEEDSEDGWARREFLKLMGASLALASAGCFRRPIQKIVPYAKAQEEITLGVPNYYTSSWSDGVETYGLLIKSKEGRPIKVEANAGFPLTRGGSTARAQAHILSLYDPERLKAPQRLLQKKDRNNHEIVNISWDDLDKKVVDQLKKGSAAILTGRISSPATRQILGDFAQAFGAEIVTWEPQAGEDVAEGQKASYGTLMVPYYRFDRAKVIVSVDADFLGTWLMPATFARQFADARRGIEGMNRLVCFDSTYSLTGSNADIRFRIKPSQQLDVVMGLLHEIIVKRGLSKYSSDAKLKEALAGFANVPATTGLDAVAFAKVAQDLIDAKGAALVVAGGSVAMTEKTAQLQAAVNLLNSALESDGNTVDYSNAITGSVGSSTQLTSLLEKIKNKSIKTLIVHGTNPAYYLGQDFIDAVKGLEMLVTTSSNLDETALLSDLVAPDNHALENWNDNEGVGGVLAIQQPTIRPMYDTRSFQLSLMSWAYQAEKGPKRLLDPESYYDYLRNFWKESVFPKHGKGKSFEDFWLEVLQVGFVNSAGDFTGKSSTRSAKVDMLYSAKPSNSKGFELALYPTVAFGKGDMNNISWLNEMPDVVTKIVWDNYASVSFATAEKMKLKEGDLLSVKVGGKSLEIPTHIQPGQHDDVIAVSVGFGRTAAGKVGNKIGVNVYPWVKLATVNPVYSGMTAEVTSTGKKYDLACTQGHHSMEGRAIVNEATLKDWMKDKNSGIHRHKVFSIWPYHKYDGHKWALSIDMNVCTGCSACTIACQSENNIPVIGKKYVLQGREMHWIRIDRYYTGDPATAETVYQPVMCQHCDNAPCETVCPVLATVHSDEGLNDMVYNRCVGTRYCANNCPYKVRRFNWFNYAKLIEKPMHMALNPDVTVRTRGVMEKCTFCVQRIRAGKDVAKKENRSLKDGDIKTACQTSCPTGAIVFGDVNDPESAVHKSFKAEPRAYALLEEWHAQPSVRYLAKIRNNDKESAHHAGHGEAAAEHSEQKGEH